MPNEHEIQFGTLNPDGNLTNVRQIKQSDILKCRFAILVPSHYREDGTCKCNDPAEQEMMKREWGYTEEDFKMDADEYPQWEIDWSKNHFRTMSDGGTWAVPRSGLIFKRIGSNELRLTLIMPWSEKMGEGFKHGFKVPPTKEKLLEYQRDDFEAIAGRFRAAGIEVTDPQEFLKGGPDADQATLVQ